jgi:GNAT superfamily N-acetyltransferase
MSISIRAIQPEDLSAVITLMREFAVYEDLADYCDVTVERLHRAMFDKRGFVKGLAAFTGDQMIGYALFYPCFASFRGELGMYLEDIYIQNDHRRDGTGLMLLKEIARAAAELGMERIDFQVLDWNTPAVTFYKKHGAVGNDGETHFKFSGTAFSTLSK